MILAAEQCCRCGGQRPFSGCHTDWLGIFCRLGYIPQAPLLGNAGMELNMSWPAPRLPPSADQTLIKLVERFLLWQNLRRIPGRRETTSQALKLWRARHQFLVNN